MTQIMEVQIIDTCLTTKLQKSTGNGCRQISVADRCPTPSNQIQHF